MLDYFDDFDNMPVSWWDDMETREKLKAEYIFEATNKRIEKAKKKQEEIDNLKYEKGLIMNNVFDIIRESLAQSYYNIFRFFKVSELLWEAWKYSFYKGENRLKEIEEDHKKDAEHCKPLKDFRDSYNFVVSQVKKGLIPEKYRDESNLVEIIDYSYSTSYEFTFKYKKVEFIISIPMFNNVNENNYLDLLRGYVLRYHEDKSCIGYAFNTIVPDEFMEKLETWLDEQVAKSE